jgi:hypothetical protein
MQRHRIAAELPVHISNALDAVSEGATALQHARQFHLLVETGKLASLHSDALVQQLAETAEGGELLGRSSDGCWLIPHYAAVHAQYLVLLAEARGMAVLLPGGSPEIDVDAARVVGLLRALLTAPHRAWLAEYSKRVVGHMLVPGNELLLKVCLGAAFETADDDDGCVEVLMALLTAAVESSTHVDIAADFVREMVGQEVNRPELISVIVRDVGPAFRAEHRVLERSALPELVVQLCEQARTASYSSGNVVERSVVLGAIAACFPLGQLPLMGCMEESFQRGNMVWYRHADGGWGGGEVVSVDMSIQPPSYGIALAGGIRETESSRLRRRNPGEKAPPLMGPPAAILEPTCCAARELSALRALVVELLAEWEHGTLATGRSQQGDGGAGPSSGMEGALAEVTLRLLRHGWQQLTGQQWEQVLGMLVRVHSDCSWAVHEAAGSIGDAVTTAARELAGQGMDTPSVALQFFRRLSLKGVLGRSEKVRILSLIQSEWLLGSFNVSARPMQCFCWQKATKGCIPTLTCCLLPCWQAKHRLIALGDEVEVALSSAGHHLQDLMLPAMRSLACINAIATVARSLSTLGWQQALASSARATLHTFLSMGAIATLPAALRPEHQALLPVGWTTLLMGSGPGEAVELFQQLGAAVNWALLCMDQEALATVVAKTEASSAATGVGTVGGLLALALLPCSRDSASDEQPAEVHLSSTAYSVLLGHEALLSALCMADAVNEEELEASDTSDSVAFMEQVRECFYVPCI